MLLFDKTRIEPFRRESCGGKVQSNERFDIYDSVLLLEAYLNAVQNRLSLNSTVKPLSLILRQMATNRGTQIDDAFRSEKGLNYQIRCMDAADTAKKTSCVPSRLFIDTVVLYKNNRARYDALLAEAKSIAFEEDGKVMKEIDILTDDDNSMYIRNSYGVVRDREPTFAIPEGCLSSNQWDEYISNAQLDGYPLEHWRTYLGFLLNGTTSPYMTLVMRRSPTFEEYENAIFSAILTIDCKAQNYEKYYDERKAILCGVPEHKLLEYVHSSKIKDKDRIFYLTDSTRAEQRAIIEEISHLGTVPKELSWIYPDLYSYLKLYRFSGENAEFFTDYFEQYKVQKVINSISDSFRATVTQISEPGKRKYNAVPSRNSLLMQFDPSNCGLYWMDALGVEFLAFIQSKAKEIGLRISINIARSMLPSLTDINRGFYDNWAGYKSKKDPHLDKLKHEGIGDVGIKSTDPAVHLADELAVITEAMVKIKEALTNHTVDTMLLVSDHGASRLCVLNQYENKWEMQERGVHSGRCCKTSEIDEQPKFATESQGFWVLANYDRFKGSMPANVEVHGGASLEEVIVPIIGFTLALQEIECSVIGEQDDENIAMIKKPLDANAVLEVYCPKSNTTLSVRIRGKDYIGVPDKSNKNKFTFELKGQFLVGSTYRATFFEKDNELNTVQFRLIRQKGANKNKKDGTDFFV